MRRALALGLAVVAYLALSAAAQGATRYASPTGDDSNTNCPQADPCDIDTAVESPSVADGDVVILGPGTHTPGGSPDGLSIDTDITVRSGTGPVPTIAGAYANATLETRDSQVVLRRLRIVNTDPEPAGRYAIQFFGGGTIERVEAESASSACVAHEVSVLIVNSSCVASGPGYGAVFDSSSSADGGPSHALVNVTAIGGTWPGIGVSTNPGDLFHVSVSNTIARSSSDDPDVHVEANAGSSALVNIKNSSYATSLATGDGTAEIDDLGGQQVAAPVFVNAAGGNYRQALSSPTINSGDNSEAQGTVDIDDEPRIQDDTVDIGADERNVPPSVQITSGPAQGEVSNVSTPTFGLLASEFLSPMSCKVDASIFAPCSSPHASHTTAPLPDGEHTFQVFAQDTLTNEVGPVTTRTFTVDTAAPETFITKAPKPRLKTRKRKVRVAFRFRADEAASFECKLTSNGGWRKCKSPKRYRIRAKRRPKRYVFKVRATDRATNRDATPAKHPFKVMQKR